MLDFEIIILKFLPYNLGKFNNAPKSVNNINNDIPNYLFTTINNMPKFLTVIY